jgi:hypothetical protein
MSRNVWASHDCNRRHVNCYTNPKWAAGNNIQKGERIGQAQHAATPEARQKQTLRVRPHQCELEIVSLRYAPILSRLDAKTKIPWWQSPIISETTCDSSHLMRKTG